MIFRNPPARRLRRGGEAPDAQVHARLIRALVRRRGFPRRAGIDMAAARAAGQWFLGVDVRLASAEWIFRVAALPPRPQAGGTVAQMRAYLARLKALRPWAEAEWAVMAAAARRAHP